MKNPLAVRESPFNTDKIQDLEVKLRQAGGHGRTIGKGKGKERGEPPKKKQKKKRVKVLEFDSDDLDESD
jgi:hypothetical protein